VRAVLDRSRSRPTPGEAEPAPIAPGTLGSWFDEEAG
jgi:hypothetical protein